MLNAFTCRDQGTRIIAAYHVGVDLLVVRRSDDRLRYGADGGQGIEVDCILREDRSPMTLDVSGNLEEEYVAELVFYEVVRLWARRTNGVPQPARKGAPA